MSKTSENEEETIDLSLFIEALALCAIQTKTFERDISPEEKVKEK